MKSQTGKKSVILLQEFHKFGLIRDAWKPPSWLSKLKLPDTHAENITTVASAGSFHEAKAVKAAIEAKRAETLCQARRILNIPR